MKNEYNLYESWFDCFAMHTTHSPLFVSPLLLWSIFLVVLVLVVLGLVVMVVPLLVLLRPPLLVLQVDDPMDQIFVFFPDDEKVGVKPIRSYSEKMLEEEVKRAIIVIKGGITPFARSAIQELCAQREVRCIYILRI